MEAKKVDPQVATMIVEAACWLFVLVMLSIVIWRYRRKF